jgi:rhodanese-related sulfurtransferase
VQANSGDDGAQVVDLIRLAVVRRSSGQKEYQVLCRGGRRSLAAVTAILEAADTIRAELEGLRS